MVQLVQRLLALNFQVTVMLLLRLQLPQLELPDKFQLRIIIRPMSSMAANGNCAAAGPGVKIGAGGERHCYGSSLIRQPVGDPSSV